MGPSFVDYCRRETWAALNRQTEQALDLETPKNSAKLFRGLHAALIEISFGLARQFPFKKQIFYFKGLDPYTDFAALAFLKEGLKVTALGEPELADPEAFKVKLNKETLLVLWSEDDPFLGLLHSAKDLHVLLDEAKIFSLRLSHHGFRYREFPKSLFKHQIELHSLGPQWSLALLGERARYSDWLAEGSVWSEGEFEQIKKHFASRSLDTEKIRSFETSLPGGFEAPFLGKERVLDRVLFASPDYDGHAIIELLTERLGLALQLPGEDPFFETTSLSRWGGVKIPEFLLRWGLTPEQLRGLVIGHAPILDRLTPAVLTQVQQELLRLSSSRFKG